MKARTTSPRTRSRSSASSRRTRRGTTSRRRARASTPHRRTPARGRPTRTTSSARTTTDHDEIRNWVEARGGQPATVKPTRKGSQGAGVLRIDFPGYSGEQTLTPISWEEWLETFEARRLAFRYQEESDSRFNKLVARNND